MAVVIVSLESAQQLAERVHAARETDTWFELSVVATGEGVTSPIRPFSVREVRPSGKLSTGQEIVHCETRGGRNVTILFPKPAERELAFADIQIEEGTTPNKPISP